MKRNAGFGKDRQAPRQAAAACHRPCCSLAVLAAAGLLSLAAPGQALADRPGTVLPPGVLPQLRSIVQGIQSITTTDTNTGRLMSILQNQRVAIANFDRFNIAFGSEVQLNQPDSSSRALFRVFDADPSIIQGKLSANGQLFLLNRNGILFDRGSQINVNTLVASSLNLSDADFTKGFAGATTYNGVAPFTKFEAVDESGQPYTPGAILVGVHGAAADTARLTASQEGAIILIAPHIENRGVITAPDGQVILAAGNKAYLWQRNTDNTADAKALAIRGLMVEITAADGPVNVTSMVNNLGEITADRGNVSIAALAINQGGRISAGSSAVRNGSIWLTARSVEEPASGAFAFDADTDGSDGSYLGRTVLRHGSVNFAPGSRTETPLLVDESRLASSDSYSKFQAAVTNADGATTNVDRDFRSWIHVVGNTIHNQGDIVAPGGTIDLIARDGGGRILLDAGSTVSAAGNWVDLAMSDNVIDVARLTSNDLKDSPLQRDSDLRGASVSFDARKGSTLFNTQPYLDNRQLSVQQKATTGGDIRLEARQGDVVAVAGSTVDVSGGGSRYAGGYLNTTKLIGVDGKLYDIATASPLMRYVVSLNQASDLTSRRYYKAGPMGWDVSRTFGSRLSGNLSPSYETGYVEGAAGGSLTVVAPTVVRQGNWQGGVTLGRYQVTATDPAAVPKGATLTIGQASGGSHPEAPDYVADRVGFETAAPLAAGFDIGSALPADAVGRVSLPADNFQLAAMADETYAYAGFGKLDLYANQTITVPAGVEVKLPPGGVLSGRALNAIELEGARDGLAGGAITAAAGKVTLAAPVVHLGGAQTAADGSTLAAGARIDVGGAVIADARPTQGFSPAGGFSARSADSLGAYVGNNFEALLTDLAAADGRPARGVAAPGFAVNAAADAVSIAAVAAEVEAGARVSTMGGFRLGADNSVNGGNGGGIKFSVLPPLPNGTTDTPSLRLDGRLQAYSLAKGGSLSLAANSFTVAAAAAGAAPIRDTDGGGHLAVAPAFFQQGGFSAYTLAGIDGVRVAGGTTVEPRAEGIAVTVRNLTRGGGRASNAMPADLAAAGEAGVDKVFSGGGGSGAVAATVHLRDKPAGERQTTDLTLSSSGGSVVLESNAVVRTDPKAAVKFVSTGNAGNVDLLGRVYAPGGSITASLSNGSLLASASAGLFDPADPDADRQSGLLHLGADAVLDASGVFVPQAASGAGYGVVVEANGTASLRQRVQGEVLAGGQVSLSANNGRIVADAGSTIDVSAAQAQVDMPTDASRRTYAVQTVWGDAGGISVSSTEASRLDGRLDGHAAGQGAGGSLAVDFHRHNQNGDATNPLREDFNHAIVLTQGAPDRLRLNADDGRPMAASRVSADAIEAGGFDALTLKSDHSVVLAGALDLKAERSITLDAPVIDLRDGNGQRLAAADVTLRASRATLMNTTGNPVTGAPLPVNTPVAPVATAAGRGTLTVKADLIDLVGSVTINGVATGRDGAGGEPLRSVLLDSAGDIRTTGLPVTTAAAADSADKLAGGLYSEGNLELKARQVYPTTLSDFTIASRRVEAGTLATGRSGTVRISRNDGSAGDLLSAGGSLTLSGADVEQQGTVKAPLGQITLDGERVSLAPGSVTSVSLAGQTIPFGETQLGRNWIYSLLPYANGSPPPTGTLTLSAPPAKGILLSGQSVEVAAGAKVDLSGGGDLQAFEFIAGPGGSKDVLQTSAAARTWAILPAMRLTAAPIDTHLDSRNGATLGSAGGAYYSTYNTIYISGVAGLADGYYPLLDAHYALLPGAWQVSAQGASRYASLPAGTVGYLADGTGVLSTYRGVAGTGIHEARTSGYVVRPGSLARRESEFQLSGANSFFADMAAENDQATPRLPVDAGNLGIVPTRSLVLAGNLVTTPATGGRSAEVDISAELLAVVDRPAGGGSQAQYLTDAAADLQARGLVGADARFVELSADSLSAIDGSLLIGGRRSGETLSTGAQAVIVGNDAAAPLRSAEILIAARDTIEVRSGAVIDGSQAGQAVSTYLKTDGGGALLRASSGGQLSLERSNGSGAAGTLDVKAGATVIGPSILLDSTRTTRFEGRLQQPDGGSFSVAAGAVAIGETDSFPAAGLVLDRTRLESLARLSDLTIRSYSSLDFVGQASLGSASLEHLTLDAREIAGYRARDAGGNPLAQANAASVAAKNVTLRNLSGGAPSAAADGTGSLDVAAGTLSLGAGDRSIHGFGQVRLAATGQVVGSGTGSTTVAGNLTVETPKLSAAALADQKIAAARDDKSAYYSLALNGTGAGAAAGPAGAGVRWSLEGGSVTIATAVAAPSGRIEVAAHGAGGAGGVTLLEGANLSAAGYAKSFTGATAYASAGQVSLASDQGDVDVRQGATIDVSGAAGGGDAGRVTLAAPTGAVKVAGQMLGTAATGRKQGVASIDAASLPDLAGLNSVLNAGGLVGERLIRQRQGDLTVAAGDSVRAGHVALSADAGSITIEGGIDASSAEGGGRVEVYAKQNATLAAGSRIDASGTGTGSGAADAYSHGGQVEVAAGQGTLDFAAASTVDISAGAKGDAGRVTFAAGRNAAGTALPVTLAGRVVANHADGGGPTVVLRGDRGYTMASIGSATASTFTSANAVWYDYSRFMGNAAALKAGLAGLTIAENGNETSGAASSAVTVRAGIGIDSLAGTRTDLSLASAWDLTNANWNLGGAAGLLTLRASGNLSIQNSLGLPSDTVLPSGETWSLRLAGGSDRAGANPLALADKATLAAAGKGDVTISDTGATGANPPIGKVRTGSGDIEIAAGRDFVMGSAGGDRAVVYTAGRPQVDATQDPLGRYGAGGGDIRIQAQRDAVGSMAAAGRAGELVNDWLRRSTATGTAGATTIKAGTAGWWVSRADFRHDIGSFAGGDIQLSAGGDIRNLAAVAPTSAYASDDNVKTQVTPRLDGEGNRMRDVWGGGGLDIRAGGSIQGGEYLLASGSGSIRADGTVGATTPVSLFLMGDNSDAARTGAALAVEAGNGVNIRNISNPTIMPSAQANRATVTQALNSGFESARSAFVSYAADSAASVVAANGNITLGSKSQTKPLVAGGAASTTAAANSEIAPPNLAFAALNGDIAADPANSTTSIKLYGSGSRSLQVLAAGNISGVRFEDKDVDPATVPAWNHPGSAATNSALAGLVLGGARLVPTSSSGRFAVEALAGDIADAELSFSEAASVRAGRDLVNVRLNVQNVGADDVTRVIAGRDLIYDPSLKAGYASNVALAPSLNAAGPGTVWIQAGRNIDLGNSNGIVADGNARNGSLTTPQSARLVILAGVKGQTGLAATDTALNAAFTFGILGDAAVVAALGEARSAIDGAKVGDAASLDRLAGALGTVAAAASSDYDTAKAAATARAALANARSLPAPVLDALLAGLKQVAGIGGNGGSAVAATALSRLVAATFPDGQAGAGVIDMFRSKIQTTGDSGIDILAPGYGAAGQAAGTINVGVPGGAAGGNLGILTQAGGEIRSLVSGDFNVNQSKVLTAQGGDIMLYSMDGSIDAGRGALTSKTSSPPRRVAIHDQDGALIGYAFLPPIDVAGSGIRTVTSDPDGPGPLLASKAGSIYLFAPKGTIDAGEAGIASGGNIRIDGKFVLGEANISAAGAKSGVPQADTGGVGALSGAANITGGSSKQGDDAARSVVPATRGTDPVRPTLVSVEVLGYGE